MFFRPPFWQASPHTIIPQEIYHQAAYQVVAEWLCDASQLTTVSQARRDLARLAIAAHNVNEPTLAKQARLWHKRLPIRPPLREPLAVQIRGFFSIVDENEDLLEAISASERAMSVFNPNEIEMKAETIAARDDNIHYMLAGLFK